jgi:nitrite reductase/ring-hydroxylating ferredoxin subunit
MAPLLVAKLSELDEGVPFPVVAASRKIVLVKWHGEVFAVRNICPHQSATFNAGCAHHRIVGERTGESSWDLAVADGAPVVVCPWHNWEFDLGTGYCTTDERFRVRAYTTEIRDDDVLVDMSR